MSSVSRKFSGFFSGLAREIFEVTWILYKMMIPVVIVVKLLEEFGAIELVTGLLAPLMGWVGLPESMGLVWATAMLTNIYAGLVVFYPLALSEPLSVAQVTVLAILVLSAHSLPLEAQVARRAGIRLPVTLLLRIGGGLLLGLLLHWSYSWGELHQQANTLIWQPEAPDTSWTGWAGQQLYFLLVVFFVIAALLTLMRLLRVLGVEKLMIWMLQPVLRLLGIGTQATSITIIGITLGLSFGAGILIREVQAGHIPQQDIFGSIMLLGVCHSLIEDTLLLMLIGAQADGILWLRLGFAVVLIALLSRLYRRLPQPWIDRYLMVPVKAKKS
ncbi:MAG: hypothetical protein V7752_05960 [Halopseudomonas sp.]